MIDVPNRVTVVPCEEYAHVDVDPRLLLAADGHSLAINEDVKGKDVYRVAFSKGQLRLTASSYVGVIPLNDYVVLQVRPRVPIANLTRMVQETGHPTVALGALRTYRSHGTADDWAMDVYAQALIDYVDHILNQGLYRQYIRRKGEGGFPRGRVDFEKTTARFAARGVPNKAVFAWHERTIDTPVNRCIKAALLQAHRHLTRGVRAKGYGALLARLAGQLHALEDVTVDPQQRFLTDAEVAGARPLPDPRFYYRPALNVALLILRKEGFALDLDGYDVRLGSLLIEMNDLFEDYVRVVLRREALARGWPIAVLDQPAAVALYTRPARLPEPFGEPMEPVGPGTNASATPDIVLRMPDGTVHLAAEVKNTAKGGVLPDRDEVNQAVTYAVRHGLDRALLVRPLKHGQPGLVYAGRVGTVDVFDYKMDLGTADLVAVTRDLADAVASLLPPEATRQVVQPPIAG